MLEWQRRRRRILRVTLQSRGKEENAAEEPTKTKKEQIKNLQEIAKYDDFLNELESFIAEAEEAIAIAEKVEKAPPKNKGGFFSSLRFISGKEAIEEAETLITNAEERTPKAASLHVILSSDVLQLQ